MSWLAVFPQAVFVAACRTLPRLEAEESILTATRTALGAGAFSQEIADSTMQRWRNQTEGLTAETPSPVDARPDPPQGIAIRMVPKRKKTAVPTDGPSAAR